MIEKITVTVLKNKMFLRIAFFLWLITITILSVMPSLIWQMGYQTNSAIS